MNWFMRKFVCGDRWHNANVEARAFFGMQMIPGFVNRIEDGWKYKCVAMRCKWCKQDVVIGIAHQEKVT